LKTAGGVALKREWYIVAFNGQCCMSLYVCDVARTSMFAVVENKREDMLKLAETEANGCQFGVKRDNRAVRTK
jgi:hypothetical protein